MGLTFGCLGGPEGDNYDGILRMLDVLLSSEVGEAEKRKVLQEDYDIAMTRELDQEVSAMCNLSSGVLEKGLRRGRAEGVAETTLSNIKNLMETLGLTIEQAMAALKVPEPDRSKYAKQLNCQ